MVGVLADAVPWWQHVTWEHVLMVLGVIGWVFDRLGKVKLRRALDAVIVGVERYRRSARPVDNVAVREAIHTESIKRGAEDVLNPLVQILTRALRGRE